MTSSFLTMFWKEWRELRRTRGGLAGALVSVILPLGLLGIILPWQIGDAWLETPAGLGFWCWTALLAVVPHGADGIAGERERHTLETLLATPLPDHAILLGKIAAVVLHGWTMGTASALLALAAVNLGHWDGALRLYPPAVFAAGALLCALSAALGALAGTLFSLRAPTVRQAQQALGALVLSLALAPLLLAGLVPARWWSGREAAGGPVAVAPVAALVLGLLALGLIDSLLFLAALRRFQRHRLLLD